MASVSDDFTTDPSGRWTQCWNSMAWSSGEYSNGASGSWAVYTTGTGSVVHYVKAKIASDISTSYWGLILRSTGTGSDGAYEVYVSNGTSVVVGRIGANGWIEDISGGMSVSFAENDVLAVTITGIGASTTVRIWKNPSNNFPVSATGWDTAIDTCDASTTLTTATYYDTGTKVGIGSTAVSVSYDDFYGGAFDAVTGPFPTFRPDLP